MNRKLKITELNRISTEEFKEAEKLPLTVVLDNIRSLHNIGSVFRTSDAFRIECIYLCGITATPPHSEMHKTALGAEFTVDWKYVNNTVEAVEKGLKEQYTPRMKKLSFSQGKLLIKLVDRQTHSTSYELVKAFMGPFKAGFYQTFAALFGASLKKQYDPTGDDALTERVILMVESGQL